ncbi:MAG: ABC transporter permease subunit [Euryarchaeota archaeon]|nr:ABC transporter permease subunit [Euryarchaeota archaeon]
MNVAVFRKTLWDLRWGLVGWGVGLAIYAALMNGLFPSLKANPALDAYVESLPEEISRIFFEGGGGSFTDYGTFIRAEFLAFLPLLLSIWIVGAAARIVVGEEEGKTVDLLLAQPVSRASALLQKMAALLAVAVAVPAVVGVALVLSSATFDPGVPRWRLLSAPFYAIPFLVAMEGVVVAVAAWAHRRGPVIFAGAVLAIGWYLLFITARLQDSLESLRWATLYAYYDGNNGFHEGPDPAYWLVSVILAAGTTWLAVVLYRRKDLLT